MTIVTALSPAGATELSFETNASHAAAIVAYDPFQHERETVVTANRLGAGTVERDATNWRAYVE